MTRLHFQPIQGKSLDILDAILRHEEVASADDPWGKLSVVIEEIVLNIVDYSNSDYLDVEIMRDERASPCVSTMAVSLLTRLTKKNPTSLCRWKTVRLADLASSWLTSIWIQ